MSIALGKQWPMWLDSAKAQARLIATPSVVGMMESQRYQKRYTYE